MGTNTVLNIWMIMTKQPLHLPILLLLLASWSYHGTINAGKTGLILLPSCHGLVYSFRLPNFRLPWGDASSTATSESSATTAAAVLDKKSPIRTGDKILVFGGTGGVGQLVARKLLARRGGGGEDKAYVVRVAARDANRARELLTPPPPVDEIPSMGGGGGGTMDVVRLDLVGDDENPRSTDDEMRDAMEGAAAIVISVGTTAFPTRRWAGGNTPRAIDSDAVGRIARIASGVPSLRRMV